MSALITMSDYISDSVVLSGEEDDKGTIKGTDLFFHPVVCKQLRWPSSIDTESAITIRNLA